MTQQQRNSKRAQDCLNDIKWAIDEIRKEGGLMSTSNIIATISVNDGFSVWSPAQVNYVMTKLAEMYKGVKQDWICDMDG